ncbi:MAG: long-chain fatty acid--CoA ligase [Solirubrobacterales bacterium]|jgi:long-chain acyl-CoA synthetase|nr:long-chain fatty acid--CoA ligase [Solirubrobacterales bacterium]
MKATTSQSSAPASKTVADLLTRAAESRGDDPALRFKRGDQWNDVSYAEAAAIASEVGRGLIALGLEPGDRVCILANTRPEWTYADLGATAAGLVVVPIYQTNSPEECQWVASDSGARAVICEDAAQVAKIVAVRDRLPALEHIVVIDPDGQTVTAMPLALLREQGREVPEQELRRRSAAVRPEDTFTIIYTSGTTGPPKGCVLTHGNYRAILDMCEQVSVIEAGGSVYLYLPLAHSFALLIQLLTLDVGGAIAYWTGDTKLIIPELAETKPTYFPSVPRIFEKLYTLVTSHADPDQLAQAVEVGMKVRQLEAAGAEVPAALRAGYEQADGLLFSKVRAAFGGNLRQAVTGAAPIGKEILEFFYACGVPVLEGYGMTETATAATVSTIENHRFGTVGRALPGVELKIAEDGELLIKGGNIFAGYWNNADASFGAVVDGWLHTGDLASIDGDGYVSITGRKKDIIITAGGKNLTPANIENDLKQTRWVSQAVMHGDRRPYPVILITLDEEEIVPWAREHGIEEVSVAALARDPEVHALIQAELDRANARYAQVEQVKKFVILDHDLSQETGELTPTLKVKRNVVNERYRGLFDELYQS